jgi:hypothetical protein
MIIITKELIKQIFCSLKFITTQDHIESCYETQNQMDGP